MTHYLRLLALAAGVIMAMGLGSAAGSAAHAADCDKLIQTCSYEARGIRKEVRDTIKACKRLRQCRREARREKRSDFQDCRHDKISCKQDCRRRYGTGRDFRKCKRNCRQDKRGCKRDARQERRESRQVCRDTYNHAACRKARRAILKSGAKPVPSCVRALACMKK